MSNMEGKMISFELGVAFGFQRGMNPEQYPALDDGTMGPSPEAFERGMEAGSLAAFRKRHHI